LNIALALTLVLSGGFAQAATIDFTPDITGKSGTVRGKIPLEKLAGVDIPRGRVAFKGGLLEVTTVPEWQFDRSVVLSGPVLKTEARIEHGEAYIHGLAYLCDGDWVSYISPAIVRETLVTEKSELVGQVERIENGAIEFVELNGQRSQIPVAAVKAIYSPKAFSFDLQAPAPGAVSGQAFQTEVNRIAIRPNSRVFRAAALRTELRKQSDGDLTTGQLVAIGTAISALQIGQMVPMLVYPLTSNHLWRQANSVQYQSLANPFGFQPLVGVPVTSVPPPR
jgi:hypothetical protein